MPKNQRLPLAISAVLILFSVTACTNSPDTNSPDLRSKLMEKGREACTDSLRRERDYLSCVISEAIKRISLKATSDEIAGAAMSVCEPEVEVYTLLRKSCYQSISIAASSNLNYEYDYLVRRSEDKATADGESLLRSAYMKITKIVIDTRK